MMLSQIQYDIGSYSGPQGIRGKVLQVLENHKSKALYPFKHLSYVYADEIGSNISKYHQMTQGDVSFLN